MGEAGTGWDREDYGNVDRLAGESPESAQTNSRVLAPLVEFLLE